MRLHLRPSTIKSTTVKTMSHSNVNNSSNMSLHRAGTEDTTSQTDMDSNSLYSEHAALLFPSKDGSLPGFAPEQTLSRGLQVPSKSYRLTSGFEYPSVLANYNVTEEEWSRFTREVTESAKLSSQQWRTVVGVGIGTMAIGGIMVGFFGAIPAVMAARRKRAHQESKNLAAAMSSSTDGETAKENEGQSENENSLSHKIKQWNEIFFEPRGLLIRIDMPYDTSAVEDGLDVSTRRSSRSPKPSSSPASSLKGSTSSAEKDDRQKERYKAQERCRIVIIPVTGRAESVISQATTLAGESPYIPAVYE